MATATFRIWRGNAEGGEFHDYTTEVSEGMVVLDAVHQVQAESASDLAVRFGGRCPLQPRRPPMSCMESKCSPSLSRPGQSVRNGTVRVGCNTISFRRGISG